MLKLRLILLLLFFNINQSFPYIIAATLGNLCSEPFVTLHACILFEYCKNTSAYYEMYNFHSWLQADFSWKHSGRDCDIIFKFFSHVCLNDRLKIVTIDRFHVRQMCRFHSLSFLELFFLKLLYSAQEQSIGIENIFELRLLTESHVFGCPEHDFTMSTKCLWHKCCGHASVKKWWTKLHGILCLIAS